MKRWEYRHCLNWEAVCSLGEEGWELVAVTKMWVGSGSFADFYLKRELPHDWNDDGVGVEDIR